MSPLTFSLGILSIPLGNPGLREKTLVEEERPPYRCDGHNPPIYGSLIPTKPASGEAEAAGDPSLSSPIFTLVLNRQPQMLLGTC